MRRPRGTGSHGYGRTGIDERFDAPELDSDVGTAAYLPAWSSAREAAATYALDDDGLHLTIPPGQPLWCPDLHDSPLRVSAMQSGNWSGPAGSSRGQQPFREGLVVREAQATRWGLPRTTATSRCSAGRRSPAAPCSRPGWLAWRTSRTGAVRSALSRSSVTRSPQARTGGR